jgi:hypothetical protein
MGLEKTELPDMQNEGHLTHAVYLPSPKKKKTLSPTNNGFGFRIQKMN